MRTKLWPRVLVAVAVLGGVGGAVGVRYWAPQPATAAANAGASTVSKADLALAADSRLFFGHMSVGWNVLDGMEDVFAFNGMERPALVQLTLGEDPNDLPDGRLIVHAEIGVNGHPLGKLKNFDTALRSGLADQIDVALLKFCYVDITQATDVDALFEAYRSTLDALERDYPNVRFLHATAPLTVAPSGIKENLRALLRGDDNKARVRYNALMRSEYRQDELFDLALAESTAPDGSLSDALYPGYSSDGEHLNASGASLAAAELMRILAANARA